MTQQMYLRDHELMRMQNPLGIEVLDDYPHFRESFESCRARVLLVALVSLDFRKIDFKLAECTYHVVVYHIGMLRILKSL